MNSNAARPPARRRAHRADADPAADSVAQSARPALRSGLAKRAYQDVKQAIFDFRLMPGERFSETDLAAQLRISRTPLRQALQRLEREGFVSIVPKSGCRVAPIDFDKFDELYELRILIECDAVRRLCEGDREKGDAGADARRDALQQLASAWLVPSSGRRVDGDAVRDLDERFHEALVAASGNREMARVHHELTERIRIVRRLDFTQAARIEATYVEHAKILRALIQRRADEATRLLRAHIEQSKLAVRQITLGKLDRLRRGAKPAGAFSDAHRAERRGDLSEATGQHRVLDLQPADRFTDPLQ
ncbi:MAG TPA: GntR family transcriptional regulator [Burkholderiaceae bacterium]|nr:GntR family transcriptional regulator [Burkholderiaceae bacterium]